MEFAELRDKLLTVADDSIKYAKSLALSSAEAYIYSKSILNISENNGMYESRTGVVQGIGIRAAIGNKVGFASCTGFTPASMKTCVNNAFKIAQKTPENPHFPGFVSANERGIEGKLDPEIIRLTPEDLINQIQKIHNSVDSKDERIKGFSVEAESEWGGYVIATTEGCLQSSLMNAHSGGADVVVAENGLRKTHYDYLVGRTIQDLTPTGANAINKGLNSLNVQNLGGSFTLPMILHPRTAASIFGTVLGRVFNGELFVENRSPIKDKLDSSIASKLLTVIDDGQNPESHRTCAIDAEGTRVTQTSLIEDGVFKSYLFDRKNANAAERMSTSNARRDGTVPFETIPFIAPHKFAITPRSKNLEQIIGTFDKAVYLEGSPHGLHTINTLNGDFSLTSNNAFLVENGSIKTPLNNISISGNFFTVLNDIIAIGADIIPGLGNMDSPTVVVDNINFSG